AELVEGGWLAEDNFDRDAGFVRSLVSEHRLAGEVADDQEIRVSSLHRLVADDEALGVDLDLRVFQAEPLAVRTAADRDEDPVVLLGAEFAGAFESDFDFVAAEAERADFGVSEDAVLE